MSTQKPHPGKQVKDSIAWRFMNIRKSGMRYNYHQMGCFKASGKLEIC
jgi:hypothetical protein